MSIRLDYQKVSPAAVKAVYAMEHYVRTAGTLDHALLTLVKLRASYINGCAYCVDMHSKEAKAAGESEQRIYAVPVWRETGFYSPRERAALQWTEAVTLVATGGVPDTAYEEVRLHFTEAELIDLTLAIGAINTWNRLAISFRVEPGTYMQPTQTADPDQNSRR